MCQWSTLICTFIMRIDPIEVLLTLFGVFFDKLPTDGILSRSFHNINRALSEQESVRRHNPNIVFLKEIRIIDARGDY